MEQHPGHESAACAADSWCGELGPRIYVVSFLGEGTGRVRGFCVGITRERLSPRMHRPEQTSDKGAG